MLAPNLNGETYWPEQQLLDFESIHRDGVSFQVVRNGKTLGKSDDSKGIYGLRSEQF
jgi:hypothetical protein